MLCDSDISAMQLMHSRLFLSGMTDSPMRLSDSLSSVNRIHESSKKYLRIVVIQQHYPKFLVNYPFVPLTANLDIRITTRIGIYTKYPVNLSFRTIDLSFGIANLPFRIDSDKFGYTTGISDSHPHQWKYETPTVEIRVDPTSGNMVLIR
jgi:hypothetical protein